MTLEEIKSLYSLSKRTYNICRRAGLNSSIKILDYYHKNLQFHSIPHCGEKSNNELLLICKAISNDDLNKDLDIEMSTNISTLNIDEIVSLYGLSERSSNVCLYSNLHDSTSIIKYFQKFGDFLSLRNCGQKSNKELISLVYKLISYFRNNSSNSKQNSEIIDVSKFSNWLKFTPELRKLLSESFIHDSESFMNLELEVVPRYLHYKYNVLSSVIQKKREELSLILKSKIVNELHLKSQVIHLAYDRLIEICNTSELDCIQDKFETSNKILFYVQIEQFLDKNEGDYLKQLNQEILHMFQKIIMCLDYRMGEHLNIDLPKIKELFGPYSSNKIESFFLDLYHKLSARSQNIVSSNLNEICLRDYSRWICAIGNLKHIRNAGNKTVTELHQLNLQLIEKSINTLLVKLSNAELDIISKKEKLISDYFVTHHYNWYSFDFKADEIENQCIQLLPFIQRNSHLIFTEFENLILSYEKREIARKQNLTHERVRQKVKKEYPNILKKIDSFMGFINSAVIKLPFDEVFHDIQEENLAHSPFQNSLISILSFKNYIPNYNRLALSKILKDRLKLPIHVRQNNYNYDKVFLINKKFDIKEIENIIFKYISELSNKKVSIIEIDTAIDNSLVASLFKKILGAQLGVLLINQKWYLFRYVNLAYCQLAFIFYNRELHLDTIYSFILHMPEIKEKPKKNSIRSTLINYDKVFDSIGKTSTYFLIGQNPDKSIASKSIKDECIDILVKNKKPMHKQFIFDDLSKRRPGTIMRSIETILNQQSSIFDNSNGFYWLSKSSKKIEKPINHRTANKIKTNIIKNNFLDHFWIEKKELFKSFISEMPDYQAEYLLHKYFVEYGTKVTVKYKDYDKVISLFEDDQRILDFLKNNYKNLQNVKKNKFKTELKEHFDKLDISLSTVSLNKSLNYFLS